MFRKSIAVSLFIFLLCGISWAVDFDPFSMNTRYLSSADQKAIYSRYYDSDFFYQLRDITGSSQQSSVAGPQWFATVYENYYTTINNLQADNGGNNNNNDNTARIYRRTMGGELSDVPISTIGDLLDGFNFVFAEEPQPYAAWHNFIDTRVYDTYPDPMESLCIVITEGSGTFDLKFANPYARHFPFWWNYNNAFADYDWSWWKNQYDWRTSTYYPTVEPIAYIYAMYEGLIYQRGTNYTYNPVYELYTDESGDQYILDLLNENQVVLKISDDNFYDENDNLVYTVEGINIYDSSHNLVYTLEYTAEEDTADCVYICEPRDINESITFSDFDDYYTITARPSTEKPISSGNYYETKVTINGYGADYGSTLGYIGFRQRASFTKGYTNYREFTSIPTVIANVSDGNASQNPLLFDMAIYDSVDDIVDRIKFTWDVQSNKTQDLGTFFMIVPEDTETIEPYRIETKITNNTGTRYELYRYDMIRKADQDSDYRDNYRRIWPSYWRYNLTPDLYGTLPDSFLLDAQSQIAPGLVTVYTSDMGGSYDIGSGYTTIDMNTDTHESFRLYEYDANTPRNLRLNYKRIGGMTAGAEPQPIAGDYGLGEVQGFSMQFVDVMKNSDNTNAEIRRIVGQYDTAHKDPAMVTAAASIVEPQKIYIGSSALNAFHISKPLTETDFIDAPTYYELEPPEAPEEEPEEQPGEGEGGAGGACISGCLL